MTKNDKFEFIRKNYGWILAFTTIILTFIATILKFSKYIRSIVLFEYYGLTHELFRMSDLNFLYDFVFSILLFLCFCSSIWCIMQIKSIGMKRILKNCKIVLSDLGLILSANFLISIINMEREHMKIWQLLLLMFFGIVLEIIAVIIIDSGKKKSAQIDKKISENNVSLNLDIDTITKRSFILEILKILPFYFIIMLICLIATYFCNVMSIKSYSIIDDNKAIVYTTNDYYLVLDCEIKGDELLLYRGKQTKISTDNVKSELKRFSKVEFASDKDSKQIISESE